MDKIEFSDVYKFIASIGLICLALSLIIPWFITRDTAVLFLETKKIDGLTCTAQEIIKNQQEYSLQLTRWLPCIFAGFIVLGLICLLTGLSKWIKRQGVVDKIQDETLTKMKMSNMSYKDKRIQVAQELEEYDDNNNIQLEITEPENLIVETDETSDHRRREDNSNIFRRKREELINLYIQTEDRIFQKLALLHTEGYNVFQNITIETANIDVLLKPNTSFKKHIIFEILMFQAKFHKNRLEQSVQKLRDNCEVYSRIINVIPSATLLIAYSEVGDGELIKAVSEVQHQLRLSKSKIVIKLIKVNEIATISPFDLIS